MLKEDEPLVSIIVITYNSSKYVLETLESAKVQVYQNIELIVSDDCSNDNTVALCRDWIDNNKSRFVRTELIVPIINTGIPANCNRGVFASHGEWVKIIAGDDVLMADCIAKNVGYIGKNPNIRVLFSYNKEYYNEFAEDNFISRIPYTLPEIMRVEVSKQYQMLLTNGGIHYTPSSFIKRDIFNEVCCFDEKYPNLEDYPFWLNLTKNGVRLYFMEEDTVKYRRHSESVHNTTEQILIKPTFFKNRRFVVDYIYPNIRWYNRYDMTYKYIVSKFLFFCGLNKKCGLNLILHRLLLKYINPFTYFKRIVRYYGKN